MELFEYFLEDINKNRLQKSIIPFISLLTLKWLLLARKRKKVNLYLWNIISAYEEKNDFEFRMALKTLLLLQKRGFLTINQIDLEDDYYEDSLLNLIAESIRKDDKQKVKIFSGLIDPNIIKILKGEITVDELNNLIKANENFGEKNFEKIILKNLYLELEIDKDQLSQMQEIIDKYITAFIKNEIAEDYLNYPRYEFRRLDFLKRLKELLTQSPPTDFRVSACLRNEEKCDFNLKGFLETLLAIEKENILKIKSIDTYSYDRGLYIICDVNEERLNDALENKLEQNEKEQKQQELLVKITEWPGEIKIPILEKLPQKKKKQIKEMILYLNKVGDLYREPKNKYCYPMGEKSNRHKIIRFLAKNKGYQFTEFISTELEIASEQSIRTEIGKIKNNIKKYLKIDGKDFLQSKKESGYGINPKYKIILKNE